MDSPLLLLTGPRRIGKSTACFRLARLLCQQGCRAAGIATRTEGRRSYAVNLSTGDEHFLASQEEDLGGPRWGSFSFAPAALDWANQVVRQSLACRAELLILDEIGPLEVVRGEGFLPALRALLDSPTAGLVVVRPSLLAAVQALSGPRSVTIREVTLENRDALPMHVAAWFFPPPSR
jgi:nucleoside-triphosphatase THEP1